MGVFATPVSYFGTFYIEHVCKREVKMMLRRTKRPYMRVRKKTEFENELKFKERQCYN